MTSIFRRPYLPLFLLLLTLAICLGHGLAHAAEPNTVDAKIAEEQKRVQRLKKGIEDQKSRVQTTKKQESSLLTELDRLNGHIQNEGDKLNHLKKDLDKHEELIIAKQAEAAQAKTAKEQAKIHIKKRLNSFYRMGDIGMLNVLFSAKELPDLLAFREYFDALLKRDQEVMREYRVKVETLEKTRTSLHQEKEALLETITKVKGQEQQLASTRDERIRLLQKVKTEKKLYQLALNELEGAADRLTNTIEQLKTEAAKARQKAVQSKNPTLTSIHKSRPGNSSFAALKGRLAPPVPGTVTTLFGKSVQQKFGITTFANGIDIKTAPGTEITAISDGKVIYAKFLRGYGNLLIIDHGEQYLSLVSRAARFFKEEGDTVARGEVVGVMSDQEGLLGEGLHFEIRHGTKPENPLQWVNNAKLTIKATPKPRR
ncbi:murein hydrolase activator EnvC family protein [Thiovibrio frasassiensis]|uniref:Peptidoglycan DD-metalloendopeptidase family protein n=1 Tax=Thiovibrio frasassiensis TaxID=2984131 RepID=A0A9X4RNA2_9BACT|nr:peptidoglycan DD-metalloendopeptidase family protein [Thiovibrio frasassiensis]MDG4477035.1 peptidoglycan DD-metalloendopeptidase family protein [Thiovibrio frasassiensis]